MNKLKDKKILVIGGAGFIGSHMVDLLLKEPVKNIFIYDNLCRGSLNNLKEQLKDKRCEFIKGDILHTDMLDDVISNSDMVFHLAALWLLHCYEYPQTAFDVNIRGTFNVLQSCVKNNIERLIYSSSASVYGNVAKGFDIMTEDHPYNNENFYGATKISCEHLFKAYHHRYGLKGSCLRYMNVYGPRQDYEGAYSAIVMKTLRAIHNNERPIIYGSGKQSYDFVYVKDVAYSNICALKSDIPFGFYNVGTGIKTSIKELVDLMLKISNSDLKPEYKEQGVVFVTDRIGSTELAEKEINFKWKIDLKEGLKELIECKNI